MARSCTTSIGAASEPERSISDRSRASPLDSPVTWNCGPNTPRIVATLMTFSLLVSRSTFWPLTSTWRRLFSI